MLGMASKAGRLDGSRDAEDRAFADGAAAWDCATGQANAELVRFIQIISRSSQRQKNFVGRSHIHTGSDTLYGYGIPHVPYAPVKKVPSQAERVIDGVACAPLPPKVI